MPAVADIDRLIDRIHIRQTIQHLRSRCRQQILGIAIGKDTLAEARTAVADLAGRDIFAAGQIQMIAKYQPQPFTGGHVFLPGSLIVVSVQPHAIDSHQCSPIRTGNRLMPPMKLERRNSCSPTCSIDFTRRASSWSRILTSSRASHMPRQT